MVAKISFGNSLFGALAYNGEKINKDEGKLLATNRIFDDGSGKVNIRKAMEDFIADMIQKRSIMTEEEVQAEREAVKAARKAKAKASK